jgi:hypothetical protein
MKSKKQKLNEDEERYRKMEKDVFNATVPFGSFAHID